MAALIAPLVFGGCRDDVETAQEDTEKAEAPVEGEGGAEGAAEDAVDPPDQGLNAVAEKAPDNRPKLGATDFVTIVYAKPNKKGDRLGYLRVGSKVARGDEPVKGSGCKGDWYEIFPEGYVCADDKEATVDMEHPLLRAADKGPDLVSPLPYRYGFVRAVLPLYLRIPTAEEQREAEFKLDEHLENYEDSKAEWDKVILGAYDVPVDSRGVPIPGKELGELGTKKNSLEVGLGVLLGGTSDDDPPPWWLADGKREIPNISGFDVPDSAVFADRARRFTGLAFVASFPTGEESLNRRFAVTTDLRLAPTTKVKPDTASPYHGVEIDDGMPLPLAFVKVEGAQLHAVDKGVVEAVGEATFRGVYRLTGKVERVDGVRYLETQGGKYVHGRDVGVAVTPNTFPDEAKAGEKWVQISTNNQVMVLWEGTKPVYATLVSTGRKEYATEPGKYRIYKKHISATMDSDEGAMDTGERQEAGIATKGDGEYGKTVRRGQGTYQLRDVPYIQYFNGGQALHTAYWHDVFGRKRSHGCVNLAPVDAHRVFLWTEPAMPEGWHGLNVEEDKGTLVVVHE